MSRIERLKEYADPLRGPHGAGRDKENIRYWQNRAETNSDGADHRATGTQRAQAHSTGKRPVDRPTSMAPREARKADARMVAKDDLNFVGDSSYMAGIRRES
jgi:hypothetical protein